MLHTFPMNSASTFNGAPPPHVNVAPNQVPVPAPLQTSSYSTQQQLPAGTYYPTANWQAPTSSTAPAFPSSFPLAPSSHTPSQWNPYTLGTSPLTGQQPQLLESVIGEFASVLVEKMRPILHGHPDAPRGGRQGSEDAPQVASELELRLHETNQRRVSSWREDSSPAPSEAASLTPSSLSELPPSERSMRGMTLLEFHADTYIPPSDDTTKPQAPPGDPRGDVATFTDEEKIFFIHFLRWQLRDSGKLPPKQVLCWYLAIEAPQHDYLSWKKHWDEHPSMPDRIYIEARKRFEGQTSTGVESASPPANPRRVLNDKPPDRHRDIHPYPRRGRRAAQLRRQPVTDDDIRAMALYMVEKRRVWAKFKSHFDCWKEFASRPQNQERRNLHAWNSAALLHAERIKEVYEEFLR